MPKRLKRRSKSCAASNNQSSPQTSALRSKSRSDAAAPFSARVSSKGKWLDIELQQMSQLVFLGMEIFRGGFMRLYFDGHTLPDFQSCVFQSAQLQKIVLEDAYFAKAQIEQHFNAIPIFAQINCPTQFVLRLNPIR